MSRTTRWVASSNFEAVRTSSLARADGVSAGPSSPRTVRTISASSRTQARTSSSRWVESTTTTSATAR